MTTHRDVWIYRLLIALLVALVAGCGGGGDDDGGGDGGASANVTPEDGGTVTSDDGLMTLVVPPGAVDAPVAITISRVDLSDAPADVADSGVLTYYDLQPSGLQFSLPARLTAELIAEEVAEVDLGNGDIAQRLLFSRSDDGTIEVLAKQDMGIDAVGGITLSADLTHFSGVLRSEGPFVYSVDPGPIDTTAPASWASSITAYSIPVADSMDRVYLIDSIADPFTDPIPWTARSRYYSGIGAVLEHGSTQDLLGDEVLGGEVYSTTGDHYCPLAGEGSFRLGLNVQAHIITATNVTFDLDMALSRAFPAVCRESVSTIAAGTFATAVQNAEAVSVVAEDLFALTTSFTFSTESYIAIAGSNGWAVHRLSDGQVFHDNTSPNYSLYAALAANSSMVTIGPDGYGDARYIPNTMSFGFSQLGLLGYNITDVVAIGRSPDSVHGLLLANNTLDTVERLDPDVANEFGGFILAASPVLDTELAAIPGNMVSVYSPPGEGPFLGLVDSPAVAMPGTLFWVDPQNTAGLTVVGAVGEGPRRIRCLEPAGTPCAITNYTTGSVMIADWPDRNAAPTLRAESVSVAGPVGVDLAMVDGAATAVATGFADDTVHLITIPSSGAPTDQSVSLVGCSNPGHAAFVGGGTHIVVTCNNSASYQVLALPLQ